MPYTINPDLLFGPDPSLSLFALAKDLGIARVCDIDPDDVTSLVRIGQLLRTASILPESPTIDELVRLGYLITAPRKRKHNSNPFKGFTLDCSAADVSASTSCRKVHVIREGPCEIAVVDAAVAPSHVAAVCAWLELLPYRQHDIDTSLANEYKHWICAFANPAQYAKTVPILDGLVGIGWTALRRAPQQVDKMHAYSVPYGDVQTFHRDYGTEDGVTVVYHANTQWEREWGGEMIFCDRDGNVRHAVEFKPGRIIAFNGSLLHKATAPGRNALSPRRTLVFQSDKS